MSSRSSCSAQCYFDLFIGRIKLAVPDVVCAVGSLRLINTDKVEDATSMIPMWVMQKNKPEEIIKQVAVSKKNEKGKHDNYSA